MTASRRSTKREWKDPDDAPELTAEWFEGADLMEGDRVIRRGRGRPKSATGPKEQVSLRLDPAVLAHFRAAGPGWQTRINAILKKAVTGRGEKRSGSAAASQRKSARGSAIGKTNPRR
jgi:uncharacterized protein (DUF4415 family)